MKKIILLFVSVLMLIFCSCTNYEHGPVLSFKSAKKRVVGEWQLENVIINDIADEQLLEKEKDIIYQFAEDGSFIIRNNSNAVSLPDVIQGTWEFSEDKMQIILKIPNFNTDTYLLNNNITILRLTNDELWLSDEQSLKTVSNFIAERRYVKIENK